MKRNKLLILVTLLLLCGSVVAKAQPGRIVTDSLYSHILEAWINYNVYLPYGFDAPQAADANASQADGANASSAQYPVVYLLHGLSDNQDAWRDKGNMQVVLDELIATGEARKMVVIMPQAGDADIRNVRCGYFNVPGWAYETAFFDEIMPKVEKKYRCIQDREHRAVMGLSMGGGGSTVYAMHHPDKFGSCYAMSAWLDAEGFDKSKDDPKVPKDCLYYTCESVYGTAPVRYLDTLDDKSLASLREVKWFFDCGDDDSLLYLSVDLHRKMQQKGIHSELRVRNGVHNWEYWHLALRLSLPFASRNFAE